MSLLDEMLQSQQQNQAGGNRPPGVSVQGQGNPTASLLQEMLASKPVEEEKRGFWGNLADSAAGVIERGYEGYKNLPPVRAFSDFVGTATEIPGAIIGGTTAAIGTPIARALQGRPLFEGYGDEIRQSAEETGAFGRMVGEEGAAAAPIGGAGRGVKAVLSIPPLVRGAQNVQSGVQQDDPWKVAGGALQSGLGALGLYGASQSRGALVDPATTSAVARAAPAWGAKASALWEAGKPAQAAGAKVLQGVTSVGSKVLKAASPYTSFFSPDARLLLKSALSAPKNAKNFDQNQETAVNEIVRQKLERMKETGERPSINGLRDLGESIKETKQDVWKRYTTSFGDDASSEIRPKLQQNVLRSLTEKDLRETPQVFDEAQAFVNQYQGKIPASVREQLLEDTNRELTSFYQKNGWSQQAAEANPRVRFQLALSRTLRESLDEDLGKLSGDLRRTYGALSELEKGIPGRINVTERLQPFNLNEQFQIAEGIGQSAMSVAKGDVAGAVSGLARPFIARYVKVLQSADSKVSRAFDDIFRSAIQQSQSPIESAVESASKFMPGALTGAASLQKELREKGLFRAARDKILNR